jgi:signal transduction histidine kinase
MYVLFLLYLLAIYRAVAHYARDERQRAVELWEIARIEGSTLATRTIRHHLGNKLGVVVGYSELLAEDPRLPGELRVHAQKIVANAIAAVETVGKLREDLERIELDHAVAGPALLDMSASTAANGFRRPGQH